MGEPKALVAWCGRPLIAFLVEEWLATRVDRVVVVLGARAGEVGEGLFRALSGHAGRDGPGLDERLDVVVNAEWERGKCGSIRAGVERLSAGVQDIALHSVDQPVTAEVLEALLGFHRADGGDATLPVLNGRRGHPVCLKSTLREALLVLREEDRGLRGLIRSLDEVGRVREAQIAAPCIHWNINRPEDLAAVAAGRGGRPPGLIGGTARHKVR